MASSTKSVDNQTEDDSRDVVDHCAPLSSANHQRTLHKPTENQTNKTKKILVALQKNLHLTGGSNPSDDPNSPHTTTTTTHTATRRKGSFPSLDNLPIFHFQRKRGGSAPVVHTVNAAPGKERPPFVKSSSIARLFGNTYNTKRNEHELSNAIANGTASSESASARKSETKSNAHQHHSERFHAYEAEHDFTEPSSMITQSPMLDTDLILDVHANPFRSLSRGLGRLLWKKSYSVSISEPDPEFKVAYLGNVLTGWAKGKSLTNRASISSRSLAVALCNCLLVSLCLCICAGMCAYVCVCSTATCKSRWLLFDVRPHYKRTLNLNYVHGRYAYMYSSFPHYVGISR